MVASMVWAAYLMTPLMRHATLLTHNYNTSETPCTVSHQVKTLPLTHLHTHSVKNE